MPPIRRGAPLSITASIGQLVHRPRFWRSAEDWRGLPRAQRAALVGLSRVYDLFAAAHAGCVRAQPGQVPTVCVGSVVSGGSGKTPVAQAVACFARALTSGAIEPHLLCRGYGGRERGPLRVERGRHSSCLVGDEPLMHAECAPTWVARSRLAGVSAAAAEGAQLVVLDDGLQHRALRPDLALLVVRTPLEQALGNERTLPAGPLRERPADALQRVDAIVILDDTASLAPGRERVDGPAGADLPPSLEHLTSASVPSDDARALEAEIMRLWAEGAAGEARVEPSARSTCPFWQTLTRYWRSYRARNPGAKPRPDPPAVLHALLRPTEASRTALAGRRVVAFSASASPESFARTLDAIVRTR
ncbi:Tetraacyldisaccharide 4'-kinase [Pavlovales sp. CCMP2436]|nr:Tetraacyldisaccharide 4'-kinase [Pavlovales sp. CCMP2436]